MPRNMELPVKVVIVPDSENPYRSDPDITEAYEDEGVLVDSGQFTGIKSDIAGKEIIKFIEEKGFGKAVVNYKLRDWGISRQRYWGTPIPVIYCDNAALFLYRRMICLLYFLRM